MSVETWGLMPKSQIDNETIEEAIARLILEHNQSEDSHLGSGQSLQSHKASEIIDHLARSVLRDKISFNRFQIDEHFATIDAWNKTSGVTLDAISEVTFYTSGVINNVQQAYIIAGESMETQADNTQNPVILFRVKFSHNTNQLAYLGKIEPAVPSGYGFKVLNGVLYATYFDWGSVERSTVITGVDIRNGHNYKIELVNGVSLKFYVDDVLRVNVSNPYVSNNSLFAFFYLKQTSSSYRIMRIQSFHFDADYV